MEVQNYETLPNFQESIPSTADGWVDFFSRHVAIAEKSDFSGMPDPQSMTEEISVVTCHVFEELLREGVLVADQGGKTGVTKNITPKTVRFNTDFGSMDAADQILIAELIWEMALRRLATIQSKNEYVNEKGEALAFAEIVIIFKTLDCTADTRGSVRRALMEQVEISQEKANSLRKAVSTDYAKAVNAFAAKLAAEGHPFATQREAIRAYRESRGRFSGRLDVPADSAKLAIYLADNEVYFEDKKAEAIFKGVLDELKGLLRQEGMIEDEHFIYPFALSERELNDVDEWLMEAIKNRMTLQTAAEHGALQMPKAEDPLKKISNLVYNNVFASGVSILNLSELKGRVSEKETLFLAIIQNLAEQATKNTNVFFDQPIFDQLAAMNGRKYAYQEMSKAYVTLGRFDLLLEVTIRGLTEFFDNLILAQHYVIALCHLERLNDAQDFIETFEDPTQKNLLRTFLPIPN